VSRLQSSEKKKRLKKKQRKEAMGKNKSSWVWKSKGGFFVETEEGKARCEYRPVTDEGPGEVCGHVLVVHTRNMVAHLTMHGERKDMWAERQSEKMNKGAFSQFVSGKIILAAEELKEQQALLAIALCNDLKPISSFEKKPPRILQPLGRCNTYLTYSLSIKR